MIEAVLTPAGPWSHGAVADVEAYIDDGLGAPDLTYVGQTIYLVYDQSATAPTFTEGYLDGDIEAVIDVDGIARFTVSFVADFAGALGEQAWIKAVLAPQGTFTARLTDSLIGSGTLDGHTPSSPEPFTWGSAAAFGTLSADGLLVNSTTERDYSVVDATLGTEYEMGVTVTPKVASASNNYIFLDLEGQSSQVTPENYGFATLNLRDDAGSTVGHYSDLTLREIEVPISDVAADATIDFKLQQFDDWQLVFLDGVYVIGAYMGPLPDADARWPVMSVDNSPSALSWLTDFFLSSYSEEEPVVEGPCFETDYTCFSAVAPATTEVAPTVRIVLDDACIPEGTLEEY